MKRMPRALARDMEKRFSDLATRVPRVPHGSLTLHLEAFSHEPALMFLWAWYARQFDVRVYVHRPEGRGFVKMPRSLARALADHWPELAEMVRQGRKGMIFPYLHLFEGDPELFYDTVWYALSHRLGVLVPRESEEDGYYPFNGPPGSQTWGLARR